MKRVFNIGLISLLCLGVFAWVVTAQEDEAESGLDALPPGATAVPLPTRLPPSLPVSRVQNEDVTLEIFFASLPQGNTGLLRVVGEGLTGARARFREQLIDFYAVPDDGFYGLITANIEQATRTYPLEVYAIREDSSRVALMTEVAVGLGAFIRQDVVIPSDKAFLVDVDIERNELARITSVFSTFTPERMWDETGFQLPVLSTLTSPFGAFRTFNGTLNTRHTGWDIRTVLGTPIMASAGGRVAYTGFMEIHGNIVIIDHGYGVFSTYSHFSQTHVTRGQTVTKGQIIGMAGDTGRTSGPHFHWEMAVNGDFIDAVQFIQLWQP